MPLLDIRNLTIEFKTGDEWVKAVDRVSMTLTEGEIRGLVGESGSGKSLIAKAICGVNKDNWRVTADRMRFDDIDLLRLSARERRKLVGHNVSMIFQEPQSCLDPSERVGRQLMQNIPAWTYKGRWWQRFGWRKRRAIELLHRVGIKDHKDAMRSFPYELTEGECQKVMIAIALANQPRLLIADEPTNSMEPTTQAQIFRLLTRLNQNSNTTILLISHDLQMLSQWADKINVLYCGQTVETAPSKELVTMPHHPYTQALIRAIPDFGSAMPHKSRLNTLPGAIPLLEQLPIGCRLGPRCPYAQKRSIRLSQTELNGMIIQFADAFHVIGKLQAVEIGEVAAINVMPRVVAVKNSLEGKHHIVGIHFTSGSKPVGFLKRNIATQVEAIGRAVVEYFPAFGKFRHQAIGIGIDIQQSIIKLGGKGIDN